MRSASAAIATIFLSTSALGQAVDIFKMPRSNSTHMGVTAISTLPGNETLAKRDVPDTVVALVADLGDRSFVKRRDATSALLDEKVPIEDLLAILARGDVSPEAQHRLIAIVSDRVLNRPVGALGVQMDLVDRGDGVLVTNCIAGMPAEAHLKPGDRIVAIDGRAVEEPTDLTSIVQAKDPGAPIRVEAIRVERGPKGEPILENGAARTKRIDVSFPLGSSRQLDEAGTASVARVPVSQERQEFAREVRLRFAPRVVAVTMPEDREALRRFAVLDPDTHPDVQSLKRLIDIYKAERRVWDASTLNALEATLQNLRRQSNDSSYAESQREWFRRVAKRYEELLPKAE